MTSRQNRLHGSLLVTYCGIVLSALGLYLLPIWSPLFGIGLTMTWMGVLHQSLEGMINKGGRIHWQHLLIGVILLTLVLYVIVSAIVDYGHSLTQRVGIVVVANALHTIITFWARASNTRTSASNNLVVAPPMHDKR